MSMEERLERVVTALSGMVEAQRMHAETVSQLMQAVGAFIDSSDARITRIEQKIDAFVDSADVRMTRTEQNLDVLIRAITAEHSNGGTTH